MAVQSAKELTAYTKAHKLAMQVFELRKRLPLEDRIELGKMLGSMILNSDRFLERYRWLLTPDS